ncbi:MAG: helix-turn-helix transcriptional regulator [Mesorhizobium sp.]
MADRRTQADEHADAGIRALAEVSRLARLATAGVIPDAIRRCRRAAMQHGATSFALFFTGRDVGSDRLVASFDEAFPGTSQVTASIMASGSEELSRHATHWAVPAIWSVDALSEPISLYASSMTKRLTPQPGIALPVSADNGQTGLFVFTGPDIDITSRATMALHLACHEIFASVAALRTGSTSSASAVTNREIECLKLAAAGRTSDDIARILGLSVHTANQYLTSAGAKLDAVNRMQAVAKAIRLGVID